VDDFAQIHEFERVAVRAGFGFGDQQQRVEGRDEAVGFGDRAFEGRHLFVARRVAHQRAFEFVAQAVQRRAQVVGDVVGHLAHAHHEPLDLFEHLIQVAGEIVEFVAAALHGDAAGQVAGHDFAAGAVDDFQTAHDVAADPYAARDAEEAGDAQCPQQGRADRAFDRVHLFHVASDEQAEAAGQHHLHGAAGADFLIFFDAARVAEVDPALRRLGCIRRPTRKIAGKRRVAERQEIERALAWP